MSDLRSAPQLRQAAWGVAFGVALAIGAWVAGGALGGLLPRNVSTGLRTVVPAAAPALPTPVIPNCDTYPNPNPYRVLESHRPDVLQFYASNGWDPRTKCRQIYDDWLGHAQNGHPPTTAQAYVSAQGWTPPLPTPSPPPDCVAPADVIGAVGFDPYAILARQRAGVLAMYAAHQWDPSTRCSAIFDDWTRKGADDGTATTAAAYVIAHGWAPATRLPTPTALPSCAGPAGLASKLGFDPYAILAVNRPDVLTLYAANGWKPATQCVAIFDNWLQHPDGGPAMSAAQFVENKGWAHAAANAPASPGAAGAPGYGT